MCCHIRSASVSRRRRSISRQAPTLPPLAMLDLSKPGELKAHEFLLRATNPKDQDVDTAGCSPAWGRAAVRCAVGVPGQEDEAVCAGGGES
jgi:hypothetical protein